MPVFAVTTAKGVNWDHARGIRQQRFWDEHAAFADRLVGQGGCHSRRAGDERLG